jgi:hypothetical protein
MQAQANWLQILTRYLSCQWSLWFSMPATFEKPEEKKRRHLKALFLKGQVHGWPITKLLVDGDAAVNIHMPCFASSGKAKKT